MRKTKRSQAQQTKSRNESDIEVFAGVRSQGEEHLYGRFVMAHFQGDREGIVGEGDFGAVSGGRDSAAGKDGHCVFISWTAFGVDEFEVG